MRAQEDYRILGASPDASDEELKKAYHRRAKALHPDTLRAEGLSEDRLRAANEQMVRLNAAWSRIRRARGLK